MVYADDLRDYIAKEGVRTVCTVCAKGVGVILSKRSLALCSPECERSWVATCALNGSPALISPRGQWVNSGSAWARRCWAPDKTGAYSG